MLRSTRTLASLIRSLTFGTALVVGTTAVSTTVIGCKDESQPKYWVEKLGENAWKARSIKRLEQFFEDALTKANKDRTRPEVTSLLDQIVEPLTQVYVNDFDTLDAKTRTGLIKLLASFQDERTTPALKKAFEEFAKKPKEKDYEDMRWASRATADLRKAGKGAELAEPMLNAFLKLKFTSMVGGITFKDLTAAMLIKPEKSWSGPLIALLGTDIEKPKQGELELQRQINDQIFWQTTAARLLGEIGDPAAVEPLFMVVLDPTKGAVATTAVMALVKLGKPATDTALKLLKGEDDKLKTHSLARMQKFTDAKEPPKDEPYMQMAAVVLGTMGRAETIPTMIEVMKAQKGGNQALVASELAKIPATDVSKAAFKEVFASQSIDSRMPPQGANSLLALTEQAALFFDADLTPWLLEQADKQKGSGEDVKTLQANLTVSAMKLMKPDQVAAVKAAVEKHGTKVEKDLFAEAESLMKECGDRTACYLERVEKSENQDQKKQFTGMKAAYMIAILGDEAARDSLIERLDAIENPAIRHVVANVIDRLTPQGSVEVADKLQKIIDKNAESPDAQKARGDQSLQGVAYRIRARAGS
ncbi:MAG: hypothetical protein KIT72_17205 [Polyangiaceae bacterium]|nr:hypothetical protein [Polyangiaceae bacterium]MCW5792157.1 hypothetical protein [Polyangiaceae bacterium]